MQTTYQTVVIGEGNHASLLIPDANRAEIGASKRAPLKITINGHTYQSTATGVNGQCRVVFPIRDREAAHVSAGDTVTVTLELDSGYREVEMSAELVKALKDNDLQQLFRDLTYSKRREYARSVMEAKSAATRERRIHTIIAALKP